VRRIFGNAMDALMAKITSGTTDWMLGDLVGSIRDIEGPTGALLDHRDWDAFGNLKNETNATYTDRYGYTGREWSTELSLQYNRARWYDPVTKRWLSQDPLGFDAGDSNLYRYLKNQPSAETDSKGLGPDDDFNAEYKAYRDGHISSGAAGPLLSPDQYKKFYWMPPQTHSNSGPSAGAAVKKLLDNVPAAPAPSAKAMGPPVLPGDKQLGITPDEVAKAPEDKEAFRSFANNAAIIPGFGLPGAFVSAGMDYSEGNYISGTLWLLPLVPAVRKIVGMASAARAGPSPAIQAGTFAFPTKGGGPIKTSWGWRDPVTGQWLSRETVWRRQVSELRGRILEAEEALEGIERRGRNFGYGPHRVTGTESYLRQLRAQLADLITRGPN
jgi:RHS repeat-associated protein